MKHKVNIHDDIDRTIHNVCSYVQQNINEGSLVEITEIAEVTKALAKLVTARALLNRY